MLTADLVRPRVRAKHQQLTVNWLELDEWHETALDLLDRFSNCLGKPRHEWEAALELYIGDSLDYVVIRGLAKVLTDNATFTMIDIPMPPSDFRHEVFRRGPVFSKPDLFQPHTREEIFGDILEDDIGEQLLFADRPSEYILENVNIAWTPESLIGRYNLELARGVLYWATDLTIEIHDTYKDFWRYLKLFKLMFWAEAIDNGGYHVQLDGPISPFVQSTTRYGRQFAAFLPALFLCDHWQMEANVRYNSERVRYALDDSIPLVSHFRKSGTYDSQMEADLATEFHEKFGDKRGKWRLERETEVLLLGTTVMIPDFKLIYTPSEQTIIIEIMGFWHPDYIRRKLAKIHAAKLDNFLLLVYEGINVTNDQLQDIPAEVLYFKNKPVLKDVLALAEHMISAN